MIGWWQFGHRWFLVQWQFIIWPFYLYPLGLNLLWNEFYYGFWHLQCLIVGWFGVWFRKFCASDWQKQIFGSWYWKLNKKKKKKKKSNVWLKEKRVNYTNLPQGFKEWCSLPPILLKMALPSLRSVRKKYSLVTMATNYSIFFNEDSLWRNHGQSRNFLG